MTQRSPADWLTSALLDQQVDPEEVLTTQFRFTTGPRTHAKHTRAVIEAISDGEGTLVTMLASDGFFTRHHIVVFTAEAVAMVTILATLQTVGIKTH